MTQKLRRRKKKSPTRRSSGRHTPVELLMAGLGALVLILVIGMIISEVLE